MTPIPNSMQYSGTPAADFDTCEHQVFGFQQRTEGLRVQTIYFKLGVLEYWPVGSVYMLT